MYERLVYASRTLSSPDESGLRDLLSTSRTRNAAADVTGMLVYAERSFLQMIEGPGTAIAETFARISDDGRHCDVRVLLRDDVGERLFPDWTMGFYRPDDAALVRDLPGYRTEGLYPFVGGDLVPNGDVATTLLRMWASDGG